MRSSSIWLFGLLVACIGCALTGWYVHAAPAPHSPTPSNRPSSAPSTAPSNAPQKEAPPAEIKVEVDGQPVQFEAAPMEKDGVVVVPMRGIFTRLGAAVNYDNVTHTVKALRGSTIILITLGSQTATVNLTPHHLQVPAFSQEGHIMVPLRFVSEALGAHVGWDSSARVVSIHAAPPPTITLPRVNIPPDRGPPTPTAPDTPLPGGTPSVAIGELRRNATGTLHPGDTLTVTLVGTPGGQASFSIPGLVDKVPLTEGSTPGTYTADYKIPATASVKQAPLYGVLQVGTQRAPLATAANPVTILPLTPHVERPEPAPGATVADKTPRISGFFEMVGGTLDLPSVRLRVNSNDVTKGAYITREFFAYTPPQPLSGHVTVEVSGKYTKPPSTGLQDWSDNWQFDLQGGEAKIQSATHGPQSVYKPGDVLEVTMSGTAGGTAAFDIGSFRKAVPMHESSPGTYIGSYRVASKDRVASAPVVVHLHLGKDTTSAQIPISVTLGVGVSPESTVPLTVTSPQPGDPIEKDLKISGQAAANAHVKVDVMGHLPLVERDVRVGGAEGAADAQGSYAIPVHLALTVPGVKYTIVVTSEGAGGTGGPVEVPVVGK